MSSGFTGSSTRGMSDLDREIEYRLGNVKYMDVFTNDFSPPGAADTEPWHDTTKGKEYQKPHDDYPAGRPIGTRSTRPSRLHAAGDPKDQAPMDLDDAITQRIQAPIKNPNDQFPGADVPPYLGGIKEERPMADYVGSDEFHNRVESRMKKRLTAEPEKKPMTSGTMRSDNADRPGEFPDEGMGLEMSEQDKRDEFMMKKHLAEVDEALWNKAKRASQDAFGKIKWPFVNYWYHEHGGK